jgi:penicillin-binding protein 1A
LFWGSLVPLAGMLAGLVVLALTYAFASTPLPKDLKLDASAEVFDVHGKLIGSYTNGERRYLINTRQLPKYVSQAVIAAEDREFYNEGGISFRGTLRAAWADISGGSIQQGGSTLTQQYVKNAILNDPSRTFSRKIKEAVLAIKLDHRYSKQRILGFYLNTIYLGRGAYGIEAAARTYFGVHADQLSVSQAAYLASIIPAPESYQPQDNQHVARQRRNTVLHEMVSQGYLSHARAHKLAKSKVKTKPDTSITATNEKAAYFMEWLRKEYLDPTYHQCLYTCGLKIYTTLDLGLQKQAEQAVASTLTSKSDPPAALVSITPQGEVRAMVGNSRSFESVKAARGFNYATDPPGRQAGSSFKPYTLMTAIQQGISPQSRFSGSSPKVITDPQCANADGSPWIVNNYGSEQFGTITLDEATTNSVNAVYAQLISLLGKDKVAQTVARFGFTRQVRGEKTKIPDVCSLALGSVPDVTPLAQARAYAAIDNDGKLPPVRPIRYVRNRRGQCVVAYVQTAGCDKYVAPKYSQAVDANTARLTTQTLTHVVQSGTAVAANIGRPVAGKTGTTTDYRDAWFVGYTPQLTTAVWMGYPNYKGKTVYMRACGDPHTCRVVHGYYQGVTGGSFPAIMWAKFMTQAMAGLPVEAFPFPTYQALRVLNSAPPTPTFTPAPIQTPTRSQSPAPTRTPTVRPSTQAPPTPTATATPTVKPTPTQITPGPTPSGTSRSHPSPTGR